MVELDVQFLVGVAVTVYLALLFFGVVVLWDVALALRSVGDKIDKLEDNLDDDLTEIGHALDGMSYGSGGGTQLHLSGGTISSGPAQSQAATQQTRGDVTPQAEPQPTGGAQAGHQSPAGESPNRPGAGDHRATEAAAPHGPTPAGEADRSEVTDEASPGNETAGEDETDRDEEPAAGTGPDEPEPETESADAEPSVGDAEEESEPDPDAKRNRGRFVTSPDRTPWYAIPIDREVIANSEPRIAGELESGADSAREDASAETDGDSDESPVFAPEPTDDPADESNAEEPIVAGPSDIEAPESGADENETEDGAEGTARAMSSDDAIEDGEGSESDPESTEDDAAADPSSDGAVLTFEEGSADAERADPESDGEEADDSAPEDDGADPETDGSTPADDAAESGVPSFDPSEPGGFEFEDVPEGDEDAEEVTVDEAVDRMNEDAPALSLSSYDFDVTAEADDESAILLFEFDPETIEIAGSTERLLKYQMRSFANQESTPDGEVTIAGQTIVVELPDADGNDVQRWGEAAVSIIDRTLYLSDTSS